MHSIMMVYIFLSSVIAGFLGSLLGLGGGMIIVGPAD